MLKLQQFQTKPESIIFFDYLIHYLSRHRNCGRPQQPKNKNITQSDVLVQKNPDLLAESSTVNGNIFFELLESDLEGKIILASYKRERNKRQSRERKEPIIHRCYEEITDVLIHPKRKVK